jgi:hypothetical protein
MQTMTGASSRRKGAAAEREFLTILRDQLGDPMIQRNLEQTRSGGGDCAISLGGTSLEIKRQERSNLPAWLAQAREQAGEDVPALAYRANRQPWRVLVELTPEQYCYLIREGLLEELI